MSVSVNGKQAFSTIQNALRKGSSEVKLNKIWKALHQELAIGTPSGNRLWLSTQDRERLRRHIIHETHIDPLTEEITGDRMTVAAGTANEKLSEEPVFGDEIRVWCSEGIQLRSGNAVTPPGTSINVNPKEIVLEALEAVTIVENGAAFKQWHRLSANPEIERSVAIYRGHDHAARRVIEFLETVPPRVRSYAAVDFDPAGLIIANSLKADAILAPAHLETVVLDNRINKEEAFNAQYKPEFRSGLPESWQALWDWMVKHRAAITQETMLAHDWRLHPLFR